VVTLQFPLHSERMSANRKLSRNGVRGNRSRLVAYRLLIVEDTPGRHLAD
jgi:hypothetical protein